MLSILLSLHIAVGSLTPQPTQSVQNQTQPTQVNTTANSEGSPEASPSVEQEKKRGSDQRTGKKENEKGDEQSFIERGFEFVRQHNAEVVAISTAIIALFTSMLFGATFLLWFGGEQHSERELRAYVSVTPGKAHISKKTAQITGVQCVFENHGQTPAFEINCVFGMSILPKGAELPTANVKIRDVAAIFPGAHVNPSFNCPFTAEETAKVLKGSHRLYLRGQITYRDAFQKNRVTRFSASFGGSDFAENFRATLEGRPGPQFHWTFEDRHNDAT